MASIKPFGDQWRAQVARKGVRKSAVWPTKREAVAWAARVEAEIDAGAERGHTLADACDKYLKTVSIGKSGAEQWERRRFAAFKEHFGGVPLASITSESIGDWRDARLKTVSGSTVLREVNLFRNMFKIAHKEWKWLDGSPFDGVRLPEENPAREALWTWRQVLMVLRANRTGKTAQMQAAFRIALHTSLRLQEVLTCTYDPRRKVLVLPISKGERRPVVVPVVTRSRKLLETLPKFTVSANEGSTLFSRLCDDLLIKGLTFHDARATALTLLSRKMDVLTLARISRHKDLNILMKRYYRETAEQISARL